MPATPFVAQVNRATSETMRLQATQEGLLPLKSWIKSALDLVIQTCMGEPQLEFVWVGDDAIDPLQQAQTLQILVSAGIKTREEARAELGLGGKAGVGLGKYNHNHDERGRFSTAEDAVGIVGRPARKPRRAGIQVASNDSVMSDAASTVVAEAAAQLETTSAANRAPSSQELVIVHETPDDAVSLKAGDGTSFYAPPYANFQKVYAAGQRHWQDPISAFLAIGHYGTYD